MRRVDRDDFGNEIREGEGLAATVEVIREFVGLHVQGPEPRLPTDDQRWLRYERPGVSVIVNFGNDAVQVAVAGGAGILLATGNAELADATVTLPARSAAIVSTE